MDVAVRMVYHANHEPPASELPRQYLLEQIATSNENRLQVASHIMIMTEVRKIVSRALDDAKARIQADKPTSLKPTIGYTQTGNLGGGSLHHSA